MSWIKIRGITLHLYPSSTNSLIAYTYADWGGYHILDASLPVIVCFLETISSPGHLNDNPRFLVLVLKQNTAALPMWSHNLAG